MSSEHLTIAYVFDGNFETGQGVPSYMQTLGDFYRVEGHDVNYIVGASGSRDSNIYAVGHMRTANYNGNQTELSTHAWRSQVEGIMEQIDPDVIHVQMPYNPFCGARFVKSAYKKGIATVGTFHIYPESESADLGSRLLSYLIGPSLRRIDHSMSVSAAAKVFASSAYRLDTEVIPCPIDLSLYRNARRLPEYDDGKTNIVFLGRLEERKGCKYLIDALSNLDPSLHSNIRVLIGGRGQLLKELEEQVRAYGLGSMVSFIGFVKEEDKPDILASADIAVFPSTGGESFGISLLEAMASGAGVVIGGNNEGYSGVLKRPELLFDPTDVEAFSKMLNELILNADQRQKLHDYQQQLIKLFDISVIGPKILEVYKDAIKKAARNSN